MLIFLTTSLVQMLYTFICTSCLKVSHLVTALEQMGNRVIRVDSCSKRSVDSSFSSTDSSGKRQKQDFEISVVANEEETNRDKAITEYYTQAKTRERLNLIEKTIDGPRWAMLSEEAQDKLKKQYEVLVLQIANVDYTI